MKSFPVADDVVELVLRLAKPQQPFESFSDALRRVLLKLDTKVAAGKKSVTQTAAQMLAELDALSEEELEKLRANYKVERRVRAPTPRIEDWISSVPELNKVPSLNSWQAICDHLGIETGGDSARRKLRKWVQAKRPKWPPVPMVGL